jgi:hypothetical protein
MVIPVRQRNAECAVSQTFSLLSTALRDSSNQTRRFTHRTGALMIEFLVAMALVMGALLPLAYSVAKENRLARALYQRAIAMEIVDGEIEVLAAGGWETLTNGTSEFPIRALAATNLPPGHFFVIRADKRIKLEWRPQVKQHGGAVAREVTVP